MTSPAVPLRKGRILVVDDDPEIQDLSSRLILGREGYDCATATTGGQALHLATALQPDLVLLDLVLPDLDGFDVCRLLRRDEQTRQIPIVMLSARNDDADVVAGLELGADAFVSKPFSPRVLVARLKAILRKPLVPEKTRPQQSQRLVVDADRHEVRVDGRRASLTATQFSILKLLAAHAGWVYSRRQIVESIRGAEHQVSARSIDVHIVGLRKSLGPAGALIETVRGVGYRVRATPPSSRTTTPAAQPAAPPDAPGGVEQLPGDPG